MSTVLEKIISNSLIEHLAKNDLMNVMQSIYRSVQSTETALLKVRNYVLSTLNENSARPTDIR